MKRKNYWVIVILLLLILLLCLPLALWTTLGFFERKDSTPGGNYIGNNYTLYTSVISDVGTAIYNISYPPNYSNSVKVYVQNINEYGLYEGVIIGKAKKGFFLFNEANKTVVYFSNKQQLCVKVQQQSLKSLNIYSTNFYYYLFLALISLFICIILAERKNWLSENCFSNKTIEFLKVLILLCIFFLIDLFLIYFFNMVFLNMGNFIC